jgi:asparagine N-glycosylation enzyme membrane subunit Stt3
MAGWKDFASEAKKILKSKWFDASLLVGVALAVAVYVRFQGLAEPYLNDIDPYLFWRISESIINTGSWQGADPLRYFPFGWASQELYPGVVGGITWISRFAGSMRAGLKFYPGVFGVLSIAAMALLAKKFKASGIGALILAVIPGYIFRTSESADKEALAFFLGILGWYFTLNSLEKKNFVDAVYAGLCLGMLSAVWGGKVLFILSLVPLLGVYVMKEQMKEVSLLSTVMLVHLIPHFAMEMYHHLNEPYLILLAGLGIAGFILKGMYGIKALEKLGKKRLLLAVAAGCVALGVGSMVLEGDLLFLPKFVWENYRSITEGSGTVRHWETVAENQRNSWTWTLSANTFYAQMGVFTFAAIGLLLLPIIQKSYELVTKKGAEAFDYVYAIALLLGTGVMLKNFPAQTPLVLFALGLPKMLDSSKKIIGGDKTVFALSIVAVSLFAGFWGIRLIIFSSVGAALGTTYLLSLLLNNEKTALKIGGLAVAVFMAWQIYPSFAGTVQSLGGSSISTTWFENTKWMKFNVPEGVPVVTWWDYGYWIQTVGNTTTLGDGGNVGPGYLINWNTGHFFATDDYENATAWLDDWNLTYITIDYAMLPKFWAYSTLGGISNIIGQLNYYSVQKIPTEFGVLDVYVGTTDEYGATLVAELVLENGPVYLVGQLQNGALTGWLGYIDEFAYFSSQGVLACDPEGYCKSNGFGKLTRLNQSLVIYPGQIIFMGDTQSMHSTFARLWFFDGYNTDFYPLLNNGETKTFIYIPSE